MSKSLAELRQSPRVGLPERTYPLCIAPKILGEFQTLIAALEDAEAVAAAQADRDEAAAPPKRMGEKGDAAKLRTRLGELKAELDEHTGTLTLRGTDEGAWRLWVDAHPAREGNARDEAIAFGCCNADALVDALETYAAAWNGEPMGAGDWEFLRANSAPGDIKTLAQMVVAMHETVVNIPKLLSSSLATLDEGTE